GHPRRLARGKGGATGDRHERPRSEGQRGRRHQGGAGRLRGEGRGTSRERLRGRRLAGPPRGRGRRGTYRGPGAFRRRWLGIGRERREEAARAAQTAVADDPALRGVATARMTDEVAALVLDGRELDSVEGYHGRALEVHTDVAVAPLVLSGAALATVAVRRRPTAVPGIYALARLVAASGIADAGIVRVGADVTALAIVRERRVVGTRVFGLGRDAFAAR